MSAKLSKTAMLLVIAAGAAWTTARAATDMPTDVKAFLERRSQCGHWAGEESYDKARAAEISANMRRLRCSAVDADEARLRRLHADRQAVIKALDADDDG